METNITANNKKPKTFLHMSREIQNQLLGFIAVCQKENKKSQQLN